jgi:hypothetical protein
MRVALIPGTRSAGLRRGSSTLREPGCGLSLSIVRSQPPRIVPIRDLNDQSLICPHAEMVSNDLRSNGTAEGG